MTPPDDSLERPTTIRSVSLAIRHPERGDLLLIVRRPDDDPELPGVWGLPAASLRPAESWEEAARRAARDKLGVTLDLGPVLNRGEIARDGGVLRMRLFDARITAGTPYVPQQAPEVTQYTALRWDTLDALVPAARRGSLCCRLAIEAASAGP